MDADVDMGDGAGEGGRAAHEDLASMDANTAMAEATHHALGLYHRVDNAVDDDDEDDVMGEVEVVESPAPELSTDVEVTVVEAIQPAVAAHSQTHPRAGYTAVAATAMAANGIAHHGQHSPSHVPSSTASAVTPVTTQHLQPPAAAVGAAAGAGAVADGPMSSTSTGTNVCNNALQGMARLQAELFAHLPPAVGPYKIDPKGQLGHGSFSCVFRGRHAETGEDVAIKAISLHDLNVQGYRAELRITRLAQGHPGIVQFLGEFIQPVRCRGGGRLVVLLPRRFGEEAFLRGFPASAVITLLTLFSHLISDRTRRIWRLSCVSSARCLIRFSPTMACRATASRPTLASSWTPSAISTRAASATWISKRR
jgi:hypothetical protein